jgi:hypothetical protein
MMLRFKLPPALLALLTQLQVLEGNELQFAVQARTQFAIC